MFRGSAAYLPFVIKNITIDISLLLQTFRGSAAYLPFVTKNITIDISIITTNVSRLCRLFTICNKEHYY
jgi:hypothetical protein